MTRLAAFRNRLARLRRLVFDVVTLNDDFTNRTSDVPYVVEHVNPLAVLVQEGKATRYRRIARRINAAIRRRRRRAGATGKPSPQPATSWKNYQVDRSAATRGTAVLTKSTRFTATSDAKHRVLLEQRDGVGMLARGVTWVEGTLPNGRAAVLASAHRPPKRYRHLWDEFDAALERWVNDMHERGFVVVLGMDVNEGLRGRRRLARRLGMRQAGRGIDAVFVSPPMTIRVRKLLRWLTSDHRAVVTRITYPRPKKERSR